MKKFYLALALFGTIPFAASSQTILNEGFESESTDRYNPNLPDGWTAINSYTGNDNRYRWSVYYDEKGYISGTHTAKCDAAMFSSSTDGKGPRQEILLSPELNLDNTYQLSFKWKAPSKSGLEDKEFDLKVRVVVDGDLDNAETIWSFWDKDMLKESGVVDFPWTGWTVYSSAVDLSRWQGKKVKIAFVYDMVAETANCVDIDDVVVKQFTPATAPKGTLSTKIYNFGNVYIGSKVYSDAITLKNEGANGLKITSVDLPEGVSLTIDPAAVSLDKNESVDFQVGYAASLTSAQEGNVVFHTNGGDITLQIVAQKEMLPTDATFEGFEKGVPPAGWTTNDWRSTAYALEGDFSAYASVTMNGDSYLTTPRLDLKEGAQKVSFIAFDENDVEAGSDAPDNYVKLEFSKDGGQSWQTVWTSEVYNERQNVSVDLGTPASDNCYLRWVYGGVDFSDGEYDFTTTLFFLDAVVLPKIYGAGGVPDAATLVTPADKTTNVYNKNIKLEWSDALFAEGYKLYVGSDDAATNLVNGADLKEATTYTIAAANYATTYNWKVVPYNTKGDATDVPTWTFTTIADQTVSAFPWSENFEGGTLPPLGWNVESDSYTRWSDNSVKAFEGKYSMSVGCYEEEKQSSLVTPDFTLPAEPQEISFYWGNGMPVSLEKDETGLMENTSTADDGIDACFFEIFADGAWKQLAVLSDKNNKYWFHQTADLTEYAGKTVAFRWRYIGHNYTKAPGACLDMITIDAIKEEKASFNTSEWNAGTVNYDNSVSSKQAFSVLNEGSTTLKVKSVAFATPNFTSTLAAGTEIESKKGVSFQLTFNALNTAAEVNDNMTVTFESGLAITLPVKGVALPSTTRYYNFEDEEAGSTVVKDFTMIDVDKKGTLAMTGMSYPQRGAAFAFCVQDDNDWNNVFKPAFGSKVLVAIAASDYADSEDWIVSQKMTATESSKFRFYARNWNSVNSILPENPSNIEVLVSTSSATDRTTFETAMAAVEMPYYDNVAWNEYTADLSKYAGQEIYVALRHYVTDGLAAFFDDFYFENFSEFGSVDSVAGKAEVSVYPNPVAETLYLKGVESADVTIVNVAGAVVKTAKDVSEVSVADLAPGVYLTTVTAESGSKTIRILKK